jgi:hypothetical protein
MPKNPEGPVDDGALSAASPGTVCNISNSSDSDGKGEVAPGDQLLWGAQQITDFVRVGIGVPDFGIRKAFYLLEAKRLPATKIGRGWVSSRAVLRRFFSEKLDAALAAALAAKLEPAPEPVPKKRAKQTRRSKAA